jgi:anti-sigma-K factor RskA
VSRANHTDEQLVAAIREAIPPVAPPASLEAHVRDAVARDTGAREPATTRLRVRRRRPVLAFAGVAVAAAALAVLLGGRPEPAGKPELATVLRAPAGQAVAAVEVRKTGIGRVVSFRSETLPILPKGEYYELWFVGPGDRPGRPNRISAGTFHPDEDGRSVVRFAAAVDPARYPTLSVTAEPGDGDPRATGPEVLRSSP